MLVESITEKYQVPESVIRELVATAPYRYKVYKVPKKFGDGYRLIAQPAKEIKALQKFLVLNVISKLPVHDAATAYRKGQGIRRNAEHHVHSRYMLKMDFSNFFPSLVPHDILQHLDRHMSDSLSEEDLLVICKIGFWRPRGEKELRLSIGAPSSPAISNTLMLDFDTQISCMAAERGVIYTRYSDDLTFSCKEAQVLQTVEKDVYEITHDLVYPTLQINANKTIHVSKKHHRRVTGLVLSSDDKVSLGRERKRHIRAMVHRAFRNELDNSKMDQLKGFLAFASDVEPMFIQSLVRKYGNERWASLFIRDE